MAGDVKANSPVDQGISRASECKAEMQPPGFRAARLFLIALSRKTVPGSAKPLVLGLLMASKHSQLISPPVPQ